MSQKRKLIRNAVRCLNCNEIIESINVHDMRYCSCGVTSIDGGLEYTKRGFGGKGFQELAEYEIEQPISESQIKDILDKTFQDFKFNTEVARDYVNQAIKKVLDIVRTQDEAVNVLQDRQNAAAQALYAALHGVTVQSAPFLETILATLEEIKNLRSKIKELEKNSNLI